MALNMYILLISISLIQKYGKCPKIPYTKVSDKMAYANSVDPDHGLHCLPFHYVF